MPILGDLSEFPLPEILLLIGVRTGRLRLLDVPEFGIMDVDFSNGEVQSMHMGQKTFTEAKDLLAKLSAVVQLQAGMFEFRLQPVESVPRERPLVVNNLVMTLVCHVDEQLAQQRASASIGHRFIMVTPAPDVWIEPELNTFYATARQFLTTPGIHLPDLARHLRLDITIVHKHLTHLRQLGLIRTIDEAEVVQLAERDRQENISRKSDEFLRASRVVGELQEMTSRLPLVKSN